MTFLVSEALCQRVETKAMITANDTLEPGDREPTFYYWDTVWFDRYLLASGSNYRWVSNSLEIQGHKPEYARYCYTDSALRIIGIASAMYVTDIRMAGDTNDAWANTEPEFFNLYEVDPISNDMIPLASKSWNNTTPRYLHRVVVEPDPMVLYDSYDYYPVFEVYFDSAITVHDSFYVSATSNNNYYPKSAIKPYYRFSIGTIRAFNLIDPLQHDFLPIPNHFRRRIHLLDPTHASNRDNGFMGFNATDTNWHTYSHIYLDDQGKLGPENSNYFFIFPIIDTSSYEPDTLCSAPSSLGIMSLSSQSVMISWDGGSGDMWELRVAPDGSLPEVGAATICNSTVATLSGLEHGQWYCAWVRTICDSATVSPWSDQLRFFVPSDTTQQQDIADIVSRNTHVVPNPAKDVVSVISSFRISSIEVWTIDGRLAVRHDVDGLSSTMDISSLPKGSYILRILTNNGFSYKKLVVE